MRQLVNDDKLTRVEDERSLGSRKADVCHGRCPDAMVTTSMGKIPVIVCRSYDMRYTSTLPGWSFEKWHPDQYCST
jgi:hypothetical protein